MSLMKRFMLDTAELVTQAGHAASLETPTERLTALRAVFQDCGERANAYHDPMFVTRLLVKEVTDVFRTERKELRNV
ncbi:hypothetical protein ACFTUC_17335 [Streptomyces sp. NPDC056944]|uniref:hypothetical protein n=1 Tax=Streptomyces sp. NPDC056944 TaxID=3345972 RepID=UPI0036352193